MITSLKRSMKLRMMAAMLAGTVLLVGGCSESAHDRPRLLLGTTHTIEDSGLLEELVAAVDADGPPYKLSVVVAGSGEILAMAARGDLDVLLTHSPEDEAVFMASGGGESRQPVMHNDFLLLGPPTDPAGAAAAADVVAALRKLAAANAPFVSRGDGSGTHRKELALWAEADISPDGSAYLEAGTGMADLLRLTSQRRAYTLADRATFEVLRDQLELRIVHEGDARMRNQYSVIVVAGARNVTGARAFANWLRGPDARHMFAEFGQRQVGRSLFVIDTVTARRGAP